MKKQSKCVRKIENLKERKAKGGWNETYHIIPSEKRGVQWGRKTMIACGYDNEGSGISWKDRNEWWWSRSHNRDNVVINIRW